MARQLGDKSRVIREAIHANPARGNTELAELINDSAERLDDKIEVTAADVNNQKQALKAAGVKPGGASGSGPATAGPNLAPEPAPTAPAEPTRDGPVKKKRGRKPGRKPSAPAAQVTPRRVGPVEVVDRVFDLAEQVGGFEQLKRLVDRLAQR